MVRVPYLNTRVETDLMITLALTPLWWVLGLGAFVYPMVVLIAFSKIIVACIQTNYAVQIPKSALWFTVFLIFYFLSISLNAANLPMQRVFASLNNYLLLIMGLLLIVITYHMNAPVLFYEMALASRYLCWMTGAIGVFFILFWYQGHKDIEWIAWAGKKMPALLNYPYFYSLIAIKGTDFDFFANIQVPRLALYSQAPTSTGGLMVLLIPLMLLYFELTKKKSNIEMGVLTGLSLFVLGFTISRAAIYGFFGAVIFVEILQRGKKMLFAFTAFLCALFLSGVVSQWMDWLLNVRKSSTVGRLEVYQEAFKVLMQENPMMGVGARLRDDFTMRAVGSHALYIEILFVTGFIGLILFLLFQFLIMKNWYQQKILLKTDRETKVWKFLGISLFGANIWLLTDSFFGLPTVAFLYFLVCGCVLLMGKILKDQRPQAL